jgi:hypothetical protein
MAMTDFEPPKGGTKAADDIDLGSGSLFAPESLKKAGSFLFYLVAQRNVRMLVI